MRSHRTTAQQGFSLVELLIVLVIIGFTLVLTWQVPMNRLRDSVESRQFFNQLDQQIKLAQEIALVQKRTVTILFRADNQTIEFNTDSDLMNMRQLSLPDNWYMHNNYAMRFNPSGRVVNFRTFTFYHRHTQQTMQIVFQLGSGRYVFKTNHS